MKVYGQKSLYCGAIITLGFLIVHPKSNAAEESTANPASYRESVPDRREIMRRYSDRSAKLSQKPEIAALRSKAQEAQKAYQEALDAALAKEDPLLSAQHKAVREEMMKGIRNSRSRNLSSQRTTPSAYGQLSTEEKKQLDTARRGAMQSPKVREAREKRNQAKTEEDRSAAVAAYREELYKRMIAIDKEVEEILKKLEN